MKKGLYFTFTLVTIALLCTSAYGVTLTIDEIPDIIIGDMEAYDSEAASPDANLFEFTDVFVFDDVVNFSDSSSSQSLVKWSYAEYNTLGGTLQTPGNNWIEINDTDPLGNLAQIWNPAADVAHTPAATFRNIELSPPPGDQYPDPVPGADGLGERVINMFATYMIPPVVTSDTETIMVYTIDNVYDAFSITKIPWFDPFSATSGSEWTWATQDTSVLADVLSANEVIPATTDWALSMTTDDTVAQQGSTPAIAYGNWTSPNATLGDRVPYTSGKLYVIRWQVVCSQASALDQPGMRLRASSGSSATGADMVMQEGFGQRFPVISSDVNAPSNLDMYWCPPAWLMDANVAAYPDQGGFYVVADMWDNRAAVTGTHYLAGVIVYELDPIPAATPVFSAPTFNTSDWRDLTQQGGNSTTNLDASGGLTITFPDITSQTGGFRLRNWEYYTVPSPATLNANKVYRATYTVTSTGAAPPVLRQRMQTSYGYLGAENVITPTVPWGATFDYAIPGSTERELVNYLKIGSEFMAGDSMIWSMDVYGSSGATDPYVGSYTVSVITIEELAVPAGL